MGIGYGKYRYDEDNNWHSVYAMAFMDSHNRVEPILGYGYQKMWIPGRGRGGVWGRVLLPVSLHAMNIVIFPSVAFASYLN